MNFGPGYTKWKTRYEKGFATKDQLRRAVAVADLTAEGYESIVGEPFVI